MVFGGSRKIKKSKMADTRWRLLLLRNHDVITISCCLTLRKYICTYFITSMLHYHHIPYSLSNRRKADYAHHSQTIDWNSSTADQS